MSDTVAATVLLAKAVVKRRYEASFGRGQSELAGLRKFSYDPEREEFLISKKDDVLMGSLITKRFPCDYAQATTILRRIQSLDAHRQPFLRFDHKGYLCLLELEKSPLELVLKIHFYHKGRASELCLAPALTAALLKAASWSDWLLDFESIRA